MTDDRPLIGAAIIVKNEADHLRRCLASIRELCDEIVVVDTGSSDDSVTVARSYGATVLHREWDGDFSAARNLGLDHITAEWILYIDADEEARDLDVAAVRATLAAGEQVAGFMVKFAAHVGWTPYWEHRVWRHRDDVRFRNRIHESIVPDLRRIVREEGKTFQPVDLFLQHYGYEGDQTAKHERNLPMLLEQVQLSPYRVYLWNHLGRVHDALGHDAEAEAAFREGLQRVRDQGLMEQVDILVYGSLTRFLQRRGRPVRDLIDEGRALDPQYYTLQLCDAIDRMRTHEWDTAASLLWGLIEAGEQDIEHPVLAFDRSILTRIPWRLLADCRFEQGRYSDAAHGYQMAADFGENALEMRTKVVACRALASHDQQLAAE